MNKRLERFNDLAMTDDEGGNTAPDSGLNNLAHSGTSNATVVAPTVNMSGYASKIADRLNQVPISSQLTLSSTAHFRIRDS